MDDLYRRETISSSLSVTEVMDLIRIMEEAGEIIQAASKCLRWGMNSYHPDDPKRKKNYFLLLDEAVDLQGSVNILKSHVIYDWSEDQHGR